MSKKIVVRTSSGGISFASLLTILFIGLKLTGNLTWSWVWVLSPLWLGMAFTLLVSFLIMSFVALLSLLAFIFGRR